MNRGRIEQMGAPDEIYMKPRTTFVASFIGRTNWFQGQPTNAARDGGSKLMTSAGTVLNVGKVELSPAAPWRVCIRPERIMVAHPQIKNTKPGENVLNGEVIGIVNMGAEFHYITDTVEGRITAVEPNRNGARVKKGDKVSLQFRAEDCVVLPADKD